MLNFKHASKKRPINSNNRDYQQRDKDFQLKRMLQGAQKMRQSMQKCNLKYSEGQNKEEFLKKNKKKARLAKMPTSASSHELCSEAEDSRLSYGSPASASSDLL